MTVDQKSGGDGVPRRIDGFTQTFQAAGGSRPVLGDVSVQVPVSATFPGFAANIASGQTVPTIRLEMCQASETVGSCLLTVDLAQARITGFTASMGNASGDDASMSFASVKETVTSGTASVTYDRTRNVTSSNGVPTATVGGSAPFVTSLTDDSKKTVRLSTTSWTLGASNPVTFDSGGPSAGKASFDDAGVSVRSGGATVDLLTRLLLGRVSQVTVEGCTPSCTQTLALTGAVATSVAIGSPTLTDQATFSYGTVKWTRSDDSGTSTFGWDLTRNIAIK